MSRTRPAADLVEPDLPITPMLDMSFQLMAFFVFTFRPMPSEGQLLFVLPREGSGGPVEIRDVTADPPPAKVTVAVRAADGGTIGGMTYTDDAGSRDLGAAPAALQAALKARLAADRGKPGRLSLDIDPRLVHAEVVRLIDLSLRAGYTDVTPNAATRGGP